MKKTYFLEFLLILIGFRMINFLNLKRLAFFNSHKHFELKIY